MSREGSPAPSARLKVKVAAGASRDAIDGWLGDTLKIRVTAPPERGKANASVTRLVAEAVGLPPAQVTVVRGQTSARKTLDLTGISEADVHWKLRQILGRT
jgi:hypothetical protein